MVNQFSRPLTSVRAVTELRAAIEVFAARSAARRVADGADKGPLLDAFARLERTAANSDVAGEIVADRELHLTVVRMADVQALQEVWEVAAREMKWFSEESLRVCWPDLKLHAEVHRPFVDAICAGDVVSAEEGAIAHMEAVWYRLAEYTGDASLPDDPLSRAAGYVALHLQETVRLGFLAKYIAKTTPGHLGRLFREKYGVSFTEYLRQLRMRRA